MCIPTRFALIIVAVLVAGGPEAGAQTADDLKRMSLEDMLNLDVSTVSRAPRRLADTPAAVHIITRDDIRRAGVLTLPEALRLAPGVLVSRIDSARYAIGIRGFADRLARSMLVMIDGRAVYSPLFAGTYWEVQDVVLEDVDRIEVIRGPGGTLWGSNAVNGIINIITRHSRETQGLFVRGGVGQAINSRLTARLGGAVGESVSYRVYGKTADHDAQSAPLDDGWRSMQAGGRADWSRESRDVARGSQAVTVQGDIYSARISQQVPVPIDTFPFSRLDRRRAPLSGGNVLVRWSTTRPGVDSAKLQAYYDHTTRDERPVAETRHTLDVDFQHTRTVARRHTLAWGLGHRRSAGHISATTPAAFTPTSRTDNLFSAFVQDDITVIAGRLQAVAGVKLERNAYTGIELQPSARLIWHVAPSDTVVGSITRAVRTPSRVETDYTTASVANPAVPAFVRLVPNPGFQAEELIAYELGYRTQPTAGTYLTVSGFFNDLDDLLSTELQQPFVETVPPPSRVILPVTFANGIEGQSHGFEVTGDLRPAPWLRWTGHYSYVRVQVSKKPGSADVSQEGRYERLVPRHQAYTHAAVDLPGALALDWTLRYVSALSGGPVPSYTASDVRLAWLASPRLELALVGRNLHGDGHLEWAGSPNVTIRRAVHLDLSWRP